MMDALANGFITNLDATVAALVTIWAWLDVNFWVFAVFGLFVFFQLLLKKY
jgi:hypothetical protein